MGGYLDTYTRYLLRQHIWRVVVVASLVVAVVTPIHVASSVEMTWQQALEQGRSAPWELGRFVAYRAADVLSQVFPISFVLGVLWSEMTHSLSGRRLMAHVAGRSYTAETRALMIIAAGSIAIQFTLDNIARPHVVLTLIERQVGNYREYVESEGLQPHIWLSTGDFILQARDVERGLSAFHDVTLYRFGPANALEEIFVAEKLFPGIAAGSFSWRMEDGFRLAVAKPTGPGEKTDDKGLPRPEAVRFSRQDLTLAIDPLWVRYLGIGQAYVRFGDHVRLATSRGIPLDQPDYATGLQIRLAKSVTPALLCILAIAVFFLGSQRRHATVAAGIALAATYLGIAASRAIGALGQSQYLAGSIGAWFAPLLLLVLTAYALRRLSRTTRLPDIAYRLGSAPLGMRKGAEPNHITPVGYPAQPVVVRSMP